MKKTSSRVAFFVLCLGWLALTLPGQSGPTTPSGGNRPRTTSGAAGDDGPCSSGQAGVGAEQFVMFDVPAYVNDAMLVHDPVNVRDARTVAEPTFPSAQGSTVRMDGSLFYHFRMPEPPALGKSGLGIGLTYRTWTDDPHNAGTATPTFDDSLHLTMVDRIETTEEDVPVWISGEGDAVELVEGVPPAPVSLTGETWYDASGGYALSRFRRYTSGDDDVIERYRPDGAVMRYEEVPNDAGAWRPSEFFDSYDNVWTYAWRTSDGRLAKITDPRGIETRFGWTTTTNPTTCNVTYVKGTTTFTDWSWSFTLDADGRLTTLTGPQTTWYDDAATGPLLDLSSPQTDARTLTFSYYGTTGGPADGLLDTITDSRLASGGASYVVRKHTYATSLGKPRVATQTDEQGLIHAFSWADDSTHVELVYRAAEAGAATTDPTTMRFRMPSSVLTSWTKPWLPVEIEVAPGEFGDPREDEGEASADQEPASLTWQISYGNCACGLIQQVTYPSGVVYAMTYDTMGRMTSWTGPDPSDTSAGTPTTVTYNWSHHGIDRGGRPEWYHPPGYTTTLSTEVIFDYGTSWVARSSGLFGEKPTSLSVESGDVHGSSSGTQKLKITAQFDSATGRTTSATDVGDVQFDYLYGATGTSGEGLLTGIDRQVPASMTGDAVNRVRVTVDDLGRVTKVSRGTAAHETVIVLVNDGLGRTVSATADVNTSGTPSVTEYYRDRFENVAVMRRKNLDETGNAPAPSARTWVRDEWRYQYGRLLESFMDRAPLDVGEDLADPLGTGLSAGQRHLAWMAHYQFAYRADGQLESVTLPNGSVNSYEIDGYGTLYRIVADDGGLSVDLGRSYFDDDLVLRKRRKMLEDSSTWAVWTYARLPNGSAVQSTTDPTGLVTRYDYDSLGRTTVAERYMAGQVSTTLERTLFELDELGRVLKEKRDLLDPSQTLAVTTYDYDERSNVVKVTDPNGRLVEREYDSYGRLKLVRDSLNTTAGEMNEVELDYMAGRDLIVRTVRRYAEGTTQKSYVTDLVHDLAGRVTERKFSGLSGAQTELLYKYGYDALGNLVKYEDPEQVGDANRYSRTLFDADGRWVRFVKSASASDQIELVSEYVDTPATGSGPVITRKDGRGLPTVWNYDAANRLSELHRPGYAGATAHRTLIEYDAGSRPWRWTDGNGTVVEQSWDLSQRETVREVKTLGAGVSPLATRERISFDELGRIGSAHTDQALPGNPFLLMGGVDIAWDSLGRKTQEAFTYTGVSTAPPVEIDSGYTHTQSAVIGDTGFRRSLAYGTSGFEIGSVPDEIGRLEERSLKMPGASSAFAHASYSWSGGVALTRDLSLNGSGSVDRAVILDGYRRLDTLTHTATGPSTVVDTRTFAWSPAGELLQRGFTKQGTGVGDMFDYDNHHRLVGAKLGVSALGGSYSSTSADREVAYALEPGQSRDSVTETLAGGSPSLTDYSNEAASPRYSAVGQIAPIYDGEGNLTFDGHFIYVYDFKNRLSEVYELVAADPETATAMQTFGGVNATPETLERGKSELHRRFGGDVGLALSATRSARTSSILYGSVPSQRSMTSQQTAEFEVVLIAAYGYDPFNRRIVRVVPGEGMNVRYSYDGWREVEELEPVDVEGVIVAQARKVMVWGAEFSEILSYHRWEDQASGQWGWTSYMVSQDEQGSVTWLHRADGSEVEAVEYDPYGKRTVFPATGGSQPRSTVGFDVSYTGHRIDHETGLLYARNRYLHTGWGRFVTLDPLGDWADSGNLGNGYGYVGNMPTMASDPIGLLSVFKDGAVGGASVDGSGALDSGSGPPVDNSGLIFNTAGSDGAAGAGGQGDSNGGSSPWQAGVGCCQDPQGPNQGGRTILVFLGPPPMYVDAPGYGVGTPMGPHPPPPSPGTVVSGGGLPVEPIVLVAGDSLSAGGYWANNTITYSTTPAPPSFVDMARDEALGQAAEWAIDKLAKGAGGTIVTALTMASNLGTADRPGIAVCRDCHRFTGGCACTARPCVVSRFILDYRRRHKQRYGRSEGYVAPDVTVSESEGRIVRSPEGFTAILTSTTTITANSPSGGSMTVQIGGNVIIVR